MLNTFDMIIVTAIAIGYNVLAHQIVSVVNKGQDYDTKFDNSIVMLMIMGIVALVISKLFPTKLHTTYTDSAVNVGFGLAGALLIITAILFDWNNLGDVTQVLVITAIIMTIGYYFYATSHD
jgi:multisubunit Na+/H+ antiporter MnhB subunit